MKWIHVEARDFETGETVLLFNPRVDAWNDHFRWNEADSARIDALTVIARATAALLQLNAYDRIQIRRWLAECCMSSSPRAAVGWAIDVCWRVACRAPRIRRWRKALQRGLVERLADGRYAVVAGL